MRVTKDEPGTSYWYSARNSTPARFTYVIAQCEGYRCLAFVDPDGKWRDKATGQELPAVKAWRKL